MKQICRTNSASSALFQIKLTRIGFFNLRLYQTLNCVSLPKLDTSAFKNNATVNTCHCQYTGTITRDAVEFAYENFLFTLSREDMKIPSEIVRRIVNQSTF